MPYRDPVRLLSRGGGFTSDPARALRSGAAIEPEAVSAEYGERLAATSRRNAVRAREEFRAGRANDRLDRRIAVAVATAKHLKVDVHNDLRILKLCLAGGRSEAAVIRRVEALERRVFPPLDALSR